MPPIGTPIVLKTVRIEPSAPAWNLAELWTYRELLSFLAWRDIKVRYSHTVMGAGWAILQPLLTVGVLAVVFGRFAGFSAYTRGVPYGLFVLCGILPWSLFAGAVNGATQAMAGSAPVMTKVYFPRVFVPLASLGTVLLDFAVGCLLLVVMILYAGVASAGSLLLVVPALTIVLAAAAGMGCLAGGLSVMYRDFRHVIPFLLQIWMFATPVIYPLEVAPPRFVTILSLNPMTSGVQLFRAAVLGQQADWFVIVPGALIAAALFAIGIVYFRSVERRLADVI